MIRLLLILLASIFLGLYVVPALSQESVYPYREVLNKRTRGQNYKDAVLALCVARAYRPTSEYTPPFRDARKVFWILEVAALNGTGPWKTLTQETLAERGKVYKAIDALITKFLSRVYERPPQFELKHEWAPLDFLKCLDLYHSQELEEHMRKVVEEPEALPDEQTY